MSLNWKEIDLVLSELDLEGAQIQKIVQPSYDVLCLHTYKEGTAKAVLIALTPGACRIHETFRSVPKSDKPLRFAEFLKSRVKDGRIEEATQLGADRIVRLTIRRGEELLRLYLRLWSNAANAVVADETGLVLDAMRRNPKRGEITGGRYAPEEAEAAPPKPGRIEKTYEIRELPGTGSFNERLDAWYAEHAGALSLEALREQVRKTFETRINRLAASIEALERKKAEYEAAETLKEYGDLVMAAVGSAPPGSEWLETVNFYTDRSVRIKLDPRKSLPQNAESYYEQYRKAKSGLADVEAELAEGRSAMKSLEADRERLSAMENPLLLHKALRRLRPAPVAPEKKKRPGLSFRKNGWLLIVGRGADENDDLLRHHVKGADLWLHARDFPGAYVFVKARAGKSVPLDILLDAGNLALFYSKGRNAGEADLYYTQVKFLRRAKNGPKGLVLPTQEKNLRVKSDPARLKILEGCREE
jgi:predicted ribosome quality control (RQC) complex YloA/Tae2 family protein